MTRCLVMSVKIRSSARVERVPPSASDIDLPLNEFDSPSMIDQEPVVGDASGK